MCKMDDRFADREIIFFDSIDSTQRVARELAQNGASHGTIVLAEEQTAGRGRRDRQWSSSKGKGLYFSIALRPDVPPSYAQLINFAASLAVVRAIDKIAKFHAGEKKNRCMAKMIKWPNDVMMCGKKICGIICECASQADTIMHAVVGIGVNVSQTEDELPSAAGGRLRSTSLLVEFGVEVDKQGLMRNIVHELSPLIEILEMDDGAAQLIALYKERSSTLGSKVLVMTDEGDCRGEAAGLAGDGSLIVRCERGEEKTYSAADVLHLR